MRGERKPVYRDGSPWGKIEVERQENAVRFCARGSLAGYGEILRVWGIGAGKAPLLIGVAEPDGDALCVRRTLRAGQLAPLDYWPELPERYVAGTAPPSGEPELPLEPLLLRAAAQDGVRAAREGDAVVLSCDFSPHRAFPLAFACCACTVQQGRAVLTWDGKRGCPVRTAPCDQE